MVTAFWANLQIPLKFRAIKYRGANITLGPKTLGYIAFITAFGADF